MTEHKKIPLPGEGKGEGSDESSLFERASGAFGLDPFKSAPIKGKLPEREMKRAKVRVKGEQPAAPAPAPAQAEPAKEEAKLPVHLPPAEVIVEQVKPAVALNGPKYEIDRAYMREQGLIVPESATSALREEFRIVKRQLLAAARDRGNAASRRILITSPHPGDGKTFCASNLAIALSSERDLEVLLIDADFAKPSILSTFGLPKGPGFMDALANPDVKPEDLVMGTDIGGLWVMPAGNQSSADSEYLASERTAEVLDRLTAGSPNRIVIFDTPPALAASSAAELAKHVGQGVLVARADQTGQNALEDAYQLLSACPDVKLLLNATQFSPSGRNFGSYYGYEE